MVGGKRGRGVGSEEEGSEDAAGEEEGSEKEGSEGGVIYEVTGSWRYATGAPHATAFTANCRIEKEGVLLENADGSPVVRAFVFLREEVTVREDWRVMGMIATASHSFSVEGLRVGEDRCFRIDGRYAFLPQAIYRYPFQAFAEATLAVNHAGMAARFIELCGEGVREAGEGEQGAGEREEVVAEAGKWKTLVWEAERRLEELRIVFYAVVEDSWEECVRGGEPSPELLTAVGVESRRLARESRRLVEALYPYCGLRAAQPGTEINRVWRDLHTASQHPLLREGV
jgi:alkylation response protein AidB-like acyl-CoA dehydrogenase